MCVTFLYFFDVEKINAAENPGIIWSVFSYTAANFFFPLSCYNETGKSRKGVVEGRGRCVQFSFPLFSFSFVSFFFISFLCLFLSSRNESDISFVPLKPFRGGELLLLYSEKSPVGNYFYFPFCEAHKVAAGNVWSSAWRVNGRRRCVFSVTPQTTR